MAAAAVAYFAGAFYPQLSGKPDPTPPAVQQEEADPKAARLTGGEKPATQEPAAAPEQPAPQPQAEATPDATPKTADQAAILAPSFDVVRVEPDGSIVIAGKALPSARVDLLVGSNVIGSATAGPEGDFAVVLDDPLKPGDYQIVLRATAPDNVVAMSVETAVVSVPDTPDGQVLALVEEPGKPSQMITMPQPRKPAGSVAQTGEEPQAPETPAGGAAAPVDAAPADASDADAAAGAGETPPADTQAALAPQTQQTPAPAQPPAQDAPAVRVEAVEIDGRKVFVAGVAEPGRTVRGYANEILLGDAKASPDGRFLIEADRDLPVGDYIIRVDALEPDGVKVAARAAVPFEREPGETIAAVAASQPEAQAEAQTPAPAAETPAAEAPVTQAPVTEAPVTEAPVTEAPAAEASTPAAPANEPAGEPAPEVAEAPAAPKTEEPAVSGQASAETPAVAKPATPEQAATETAPAAGETPSVVASGEQPAGQKPVADGVAGSDAQAEAPQAPALQSDTGQVPAQSPAEQAATPEVEAPVASAPEAQPAEQGASQEAAQPSQSAEPEVAAAPQPDLPSPPSADGVTEVLAPKLQSVDSAVIIRRGDTLWRISRRVYGRGVRYSTIYLANEDQIEDPDRIWPGQVFKVPEKSDDGKADADFSTMGDRITTMPMEGEGAGEAGQQ